MVCGCFETKHGGVKIYLYQSCHVGIAINQRAIATKQCAGAAM
jgi:hypothetical protein